MMARPASGEEHLELARNAVRIAKTADELRSAQALLLPLELGLSLEQTAIAIGRSKGKTCTLRTNYCKRATGRMAAPVAKRNLRNRANRSLEEEKELLQEVFDSAGVGGVWVVPPFADKLRQKMGVPLSLSALYRMLARHGWRKIAPDTPHPKGDLLVREDWKKNSPGCWVKR
jgi:transposase